MNKNGLINFTFHTEDVVDEALQSHSDIEKLATVLRKVNLAVPEDDKRRNAFHKIEQLLKKLLLPESPSDLRRGFRQDTNTPNLIQLNHNIEASTLPRLISKQSRTAEKSEFECVGAQEIRLTHTQLVKYRQKYNDIPVYGAQITVEVDDRNELLAINSMIADSIDTVSPEPIIKQEEEIRGAIQNQTGHDLTDTSIIHTLYYYFDSKDQKWRLVYLVETKINPTDAPVKFELIPEMVDYLVDAHTGDLVSQLPRVRTLNKL